MGQLSVGEARGAILVTGASGFVGRALCAHLLAAGWRVRGTRLACEPASSLSPGIDQVQVEPLGPDTPWARALQGIETVIHLAARVHQMSDASAHPLAEFQKVNTDGTRRLAVEAAQAGVRRLVFVSSVKVNGEESPLRYTEDSPPLPRDPYGVSKWQAEQALRLVEAQRGLEVVVVRPTLVYGPGVRANFLALMKALRAGLPLPLASIDNRRSLIYLGNLVHALAVCASHPRAAGKTFLVSDGEDVSTPELLRATASALGARARLFPFPPPLMQLAGRLAGKGAQVGRLTGSLAVDSSKIRKELGWQPPYTLEAGLQATAKWYLARSGGAS